VLRDDSLPLLLLLLWTRISTKRMATPKCWGCGATGSIVVCDYEHFEAKFCASTVDECRLLYHYQMADPLLNEQGQLIDMSRKYSKTIKNVKKAHKVATAVAKQVHKHAQKQAVVNNNTNNAPTHSVTTTPPTTTLSAYGKLGYYTSSSSSGAYGDYDDSYEY
jgi:hypothetical protein